MSAPSTAGKVALVTGAVNSRIGSGLAIIFSKLGVLRCTHSKIKGGL